MVLHPLIQQGLQHRYYPIDDDLNPKWDELEPLVDNHTKAIMMVHYFGQPQDISAFQSFSNQHSLFLIEDNAHGHGGMFNGKLLGTFGDIGFSSPRKILNTFSGGVLWLNNRVLESRLNLSAYPVSLGKHIKRIINPNSSLKIKLKKLLINRPSDEDPNAFRESVILDYAIDKWSKDIIDKTDWIKLRNSRQEVYHKWQDFALDNNLTSVFKKLHPETNPWCFPAYVQNHKEAIRWFDWGWKNNQHVFSWPSLPEDVVVRNGESLNRWKRLVCFGIT